MMKHIPSSNVGAIITGVLCFVVLIGLKQVNDRLKNKIKVPIPAELLVVIFLSDRSGSHRKLKGCFSLI